MVWGKNIRSLHGKDDMREVPTVSTEVLDQTEPRLFMDVPIEARTELQCMYRCLAMLRTIDDKDRRAFVLTWLAEHSEVHFTGAD